MEQGKVKGFEVLGIILLVTAIITYLYLSFFSLIYRDVYDDQVTWFHVHVINYLKNNGDPWNDNILRFIDSRNLMSSPILLDLLLARLNMPIGVWTLFTGISYIVIMFLITYIFSRNLFMAGFASQLLAVTPCFNYWFKYNTFGSYTLQPLMFLTLLLLGLGFMKNSKTLILPGFLSGIFLWFSQSNGWLILLLYALYISVLSFKNIFEKKYIVYALILLLFTMPFNLLFNLLYLTIYHVFSYITLLIAVSIYTMLLWYRDLLTSITRFSLRIVNVIGIYPLAYYIVFILNNYIEFPGLLEDYSRLYNPLLDYGIAGLLTILALVMMIRGKIMQNIKERFLEFTLITSFVIGVVLAYHNLHVLTVISIASIIPFIAFAIVTIVSSLYQLGGGRVRILYLVVALWLIIGSIASSAIPSYAVSVTAPRIYYIDLPREFMTKIKINDSAFLSVLDVLKNEYNGEKLVISYWGYSYWITGYLGSNVHTLADLRGTREGWRLISWIMLSDEDTAYALIKNIVGNNSNIKVYIIVSEIVSIDLTQPEQGKVKMADLGALIVIPPTTPGETAKRSFRAFGDLDRIFQYVNYGGFNITYYIDTSRAKYYHEASLAWSHNMVDTLMVKLIVRGLNSLGYDAINDVYMEYPLRLQELKYFKLVNATLIPLYRVDQDIYSYEIYSFIAIYEVELNIRGD